MSDSQNPLGCNLPDSFAQGSFQVRILDWVAISFSNLLSPVQLFSCVRLFATPWTASCQTSLSITNSWSLLKLMSMELVMPSNHLILCQPLLLLLSIFPSNRVFSKWVNSSHQVAKVLELQLQHQSFQWITGLISFRMDWLDLLAVQGILKSLL